jgi:hypothetical protein
VEQHRADVARARRKWIREQGLLDPARLVFIDETAVNTNMVRLYGRGPRGVRLVDHVPQGNWETFTFVSALRYDKVVAPMVIAGPMNGDIPGLCRAMPGADPAAKRHCGDGQPAGPQSAGY